MEKYMHGSIESELIRPSSSTVGAGFFFVGKKCIDYHGLNNITGSE